MDTNTYKRILIVDDEEGIRTVLKLILTKLKPDYQVATAPDGFTAMGRLMQQRFDLVLTDWYMDDMDGLELAEAIRGSWPDTRILLMTGTPTPELDGTVKSLGLNGWIQKPFTPTHIVNMVEQVMS